MNIGWRLALSVWWSALWRQGLFLVIYIVFLGFLPSVIANAMHTPEKIRLYAIVCGYLYGIPTSIFALKQAVSRHLPVFAQIAQGAQT